MSQSQTERWGHLAFILTVALLLAATAAHTYIELALDPLTYAGPLLILDHLFDLAAAGFLLAICLALGADMLARFGVDFATPLQTLPFAVVLGAAALSIALLALGGLGLFHPLALAGLFVLAIVLSRRQLREAPGLLVDGLRQLRDRGGHPALWVTAVAVSGLFAAVLLANAVAPPTDWDALMYHLEVPRQFLERGRIHVPADNLHVAFTGLVHMLYVPLLAVHSASGPAILSVLFALVLGVAVFSLAERWFDGATASLALATLWATTSVLLVAFTPRIDVTLALYLFTALYAVLLFAEPTGRPVDLKIAAVVLGSAIGLKLQAGAFAIAIAPVVLWAIWKRVQATKAMLRAAFTFAGLAVAAATPWLIKNWVLLGAPLYPLGSGDLLPPWLASLYGSAAAPTGVNPEIYTALGQARVPFNLVDLFLAPGRLTVELEGAHYHMNLLYPLLVLWPVFHRNRTLNALLIPAIAYVLLIVLPFGTTNLRYLIPAYPPLTLAAAFVATRVSGRLFSASAQRLLLVALALVAIYPSANAMVYWLRKSDVLGHLAGITSRREYLDTGYNFYSRIVRAVNERVSPDGKVLLLFEARGFYFEPAVIQDNVLTNWPLVAPLTQEDAGCLESTGITHVMVSNAAVSYYVNRGTNPRLFRSDLFPAFADECLAPVYRGRGFTLYRIVG